MRGQPVGLEPKWLGFNGKPSREYARGRCKKGPYILRSDLNAVTIQMARLQSHRTPHEIANISAREKRATSGTPVQSPVNSKKP